MYFLDVFLGASAWKIIQTGSSSDPPRVGGVLLVRCSGQTEPASYSAAAAAHTDSLGQQPCALVCTGGFFFQLWSKIFIASSDIINKFAYLFKPKL